MRKKRRDIVDRIVDQAEEEAKKDKKDKPIKEMEPGEIFYYISKGTKKVTAAMDVPISEADRLRAILAEVEYINEINDPGSAIAYAGAVIALSVLVPEIRDVVLGFIGVPKMSYPGMISQIVSLIIIAIFMMYVFILLRKQKKVNERTRYTNYIKTAIEELSERSNNIDDSDNNELDDLKAKRTVKKKKSK